MLSYCTVGYNYFNNLVMQTLWWLPIKILRNIHKKRFSVFLSCFLRFCNQSVQKVLIKAKKNFYYKTAKFYAAFKSLKKVLKKCTQKKLLAKTWRKNALFHFYSCSSNLFCLKHFFGAFFYNFFNGFEISVKFCVFLHLFYLFKKIFFRSY